MIGQAVRLFTNILTKVFLQNSSQICGSRIIINLPIRMLPSDRAGLLLHWCGGSGSNQCPLGVKEAIGDNKVTTFCLAVILVKNKTADVLLLLLKLIFLLNAGDRLLIVKYSRSSLVALSSFVSIRLGKEVLMIICGHVVLSC